MRECRGWSQQALATAAGMNDNTVQALEKAAVDPKISTIVRLAFCLGFEVDIRFRRPRRVSTRAG